MALRAEIPIVNSASTDPTIPETYIPWYFTNLQDDRVQCLTLARHIFTELGLKRVAILRVNNRYGRFGVLKLRDAARRLGHPIVIEQKYLPGDTDFARQLQVIQSSRADAIVLWADEAEAAGILKQMQKLGMKQRVFGAYRTLGPELLEQAGAAAEGFEAVFPYDPTRSDPRWVDFNRRFEDKFHEKPEQFAALAFDAMNALLDSICKAGLNRARIHDALANIEEYEGVTGHMVFDPNQKNVAPMYLGTVHNGTITYRVATMEKLPAQPAQLAPPSATPQPYARVGEDGVSYAGPHLADMPRGTAARRVVWPQGRDRRAIGRSAERCRIRTTPGISSRSTASRTGAPLPRSLSMPSSTSTRWPSLLSIATPLTSPNNSRSRPWCRCSPSAATSRSRPTTFHGSFACPPKPLRPRRCAFSTPPMQQSGLNPERLRDTLASGTALDGIAFLSTGEPAGK